MDVDPWKLEQLRTGAAPFFEEMLDPLLEEGLKAGRLNFTTEFEELAGCSVVFLCVGTPQLPGSDAADVSQVHAAVQSLLPVLSPGSVVVGKSTTPAGTAASLTPVLAAAGIHIAWNPEFLREGTAVADTLHPERIVVGSAHPDVLESLRGLYRSPLAEGSHFLTTDLTTAEMIKSAANAFLATKVSFINAVSDLCDRTGADVELVSHALGLDSRIGPKFLKSGIGYGGGCFPKDVRALAHLAASSGADSLATMLHSVDAANNSARQRSLDLALSHIAGSSDRVAVLGAAFKPGSDDTRDSPAVWLVEHLREQRPNLALAWHDPALVGRTVAGLTLSPSCELACLDADLVILATDWPAYRSLAPSSIHPKSRRMLDLRNCLPAESWARAGWTVHRLGRPSILPA